MLQIYRFLINLTILFSPLIILIRVLKKKENILRVKEKFSIISKKRNKGKLIWFHGSSVGEILSIIPLVEKLEKDKSISTILITSSTLSSSKVLLNLKLKKTIHQFFPIDSNFLTNKFLEYWNPASAVFVESEIWPNMIINIKKKSIPLILLNARITARSYKKWKKISNISKFLFESFDICFTQNKETQKYLKYLGVKKIKFLGNLKFSEIESIKNFSLNKNLIKFFKSKRIWCASSTHDSEETICIQSHKKLKKNYKNLVSIIIPRHVQRVEKITKEIQNEGLKVHLHSSKKKIKNDVEIYLVDTYGETKSFFKICNTVFLGGSLIKHGGQNPLEPVRFGCKVIHGPYVNNFLEIYDLLNKNNLSSKVNNLNQLIKLLDQSLKQNVKSLKKVIKLKKIGMKILFDTHKSLNTYIKR